MGFYNEHRVRSMSTSYESNFDELDMLRDTARRFFERPTAGLTSLGELGLLGLLTDEPAGGSGWLPLEASVVAEEAGRALSPLPVFPTLIAAAAAAAATADQLDSLLAGESAGGVARSAQPITLDNGTVSGAATMVGDAVTALIVLIDATGHVAVIDASQPGVTIPGGEGIAERDRRTVEGGLDTTREVTIVTLDRASATLLATDDAKRIVNAATLLACADALGALRQTANVVRQHLVDREAFQRPIASFQAIQHRLADLEVLQSAVAALVEQSALALVVSSSRSDRLISALQTYTSARVSVALDDCIQLSGGLGFTWEWPVHHALRRATIDAAMPQHPSNRIDDLTSGGDPEPSLDRDELDDFRAHARRVIRDSAPGEAREGHRAPNNDAEEAELRAYYRTLYDERLLGAAWPTERGGDPEHRPIHELIITEELIRARAPRPIDQVQLSSHVLLKFGTDEQKDRYLPRIRNADDVWCQLFSEPDAGSDLAGIKGRATLQDDGTWLLSGQKTWTTDGHWAQMGLALLRTSADSTRHAGITAFVVPMDAPNLIVQPMLTIGGAHEFNDVFLDGVVLDADSVVGPVGDGWRVAMSGLEIERFGVGGNVVLHDLLLDDLAILIDELLDSGAPGLTRDEASARLADLTSQAQAAKAFIASHVDRSLAGREQPADAPTAKILHSETYQRISAYGTQLAAANAPLPPAALAAAERLGDAWLWSRAITISGGSSEVMRNIIAKRGLGLPNR
jgi:alkylation response protein AidB-like acyl-CoA dehydrogenase